jgi:hypothetical protein
MGCMVAATLSMATQRDTPARCAVLCGVTVLAVLVQGMALQPLKLCARLQYMSKLTSMSCSRGDTVSCKAASNGC